MTLYINVVYNSHFINPAVKKTYRLIMIKNDSRKFYRKGIFFVIIVII